MSKMCPIGFLNRGSNAPCCEEKCEWYDEYFKCCAVRSNVFPLRFEDEKVQDDLSVPDVQCEDGR